MRKTIFVATLLLMLTLRLPAESIERTPNPMLLTERWDARWISTTDDDLYSYGVHFFRKSISLDSKPDEYVINISADNRYRLFVNGTPVCWGPSRGDIFHWYFETVDIADFLQEGKNTLAVCVWNFGKWKPGAQISLETGLIVQGNSPNETAVNSNKSWVYHTSKAYSPTLEGRHDVGCGDNVDGLKYEWGWEQPDFDDSSWQKVYEGSEGQPQGNSTECKRFLLPRDIPLMVEEIQRIPKVRSADNITVSPLFLSGKSPLTIPANQTVKILLDQEYLTTAYPELTVSKGKGSSIKLIYSEGLYDKNGRKGDRNEIQGREPRAAGYDLFKPDGGEGRLFRPLWFKTYRYITVEITTSNEPLVILDLLGKFTCYPFKENGSFRSNDKSLDKIWQVGWRTARLCAHETYFDCPYYEQLQYVGDTRIQALISLYVSGDDRLMKKAIKTFDWSRTHEGITQSRYPATHPQFIPTFSLFWINMIHDYYMHRDDDQFIQSLIPGIKSVLEWYSEKIDQNGVLGKTPYWSFIDWVPSWPWKTDYPLGGTHPSAYFGGCAITSLQMVYAIDAAVELFRRYNESELADKYERLGQAIRKSVREHCWDKEKQLFYDDVAHTSISQHVNILAILTNTVSDNDANALFRRIVNNDDLLQVTFYYRFYLNRAMKRVGMGDLYISQLKPWHDMLAMGLTTFAENPEPSRSDCHAWSSCPNYDFLSLVCGIQPTAPAFKKVVIEPNFGSLTEINGKAMHPQGSIEVQLKRVKSNVVGSVTLPKGISGVFKYKGVQMELHEGENRIR